MMSEEESESDCPLCLLSLEPYDHSHPLQCPSRHCHFNCCMDCLDQMIKSTKDDSTEASDGNTFRVFLHCPNCRSNLGPSIRDTLLLRRVDHFSQQTCKRLSSNNTNRDGDADGGGMESVVVDESRLSASELRLKYALEKDEDIASAIDDARHREDDFFGRGFVEVLDAASKSKEEEEEEMVGAASLDVTNSLSGSFGGRQKEESVWSFDDEEGVEVDWTRGPHNSFIFRHHSMEDLGDVADDDNEDDDDDDQTQLLEGVAKPDPTLLCGLDAFMTEQEQQFMTAQLISGDPARLAVATEMMFYVSALSRQGVRPSLKRQQSKLSISGRSTTMTMNAKDVELRMLDRSMLGSIKVVIREGNEARRLEEEKEARRAIIGATATAASELPPATTNTGLYGGGSAGGRRNQKMLVDLEMKRQLAYMKLHPLPLRMPKYAEVTASCSARSMGLTFLDDTWDGTVLDAFSKITVHTSLLLGHTRVTKQHAESEGIRHVIDAAATTTTPKSPKSTGRGCIIDTEKPRVIVASINRELGHQGVVKGDVVTHFNGEEFRGSASELSSELIQNRYEGEVLTFVFNADIAVAEALKRRSMII